jgi:hypothetical protein
MSRAEKLVTLYNPDNGTEVEVNEGRGKALKDRGFTEKKARSYTGPNSQKRSAGGQTDDTTVSDLKARLDALEKENADLKAAQTPPAN